MNGPGIYIHIPFCKSKCDYCSFNSYPCKDNPDPAYLASLLSQISSKNTWAEQQSFHTLFIGGGTPTIYKGEKLSQLITACLNNYAFVKKPETTIETNPNTITADDLHKCRNAGANRLSIGVQSFNNQLLKNIGRTHSAKEAELAVLLARKAGFNNINLDLMFGLPGQTMDDWQQSLARAVDLNPEHLAIYELTIEEGTPFFDQHKSGRITLPSHDLVADMAEYTYSFLEKAGYDRYEISNFAKRGYTCQHNINYWENGSYLGLGAGAVSCFSGLRLSNVKNPQQYSTLAAKGIAPIDEGEGLSFTASFRESVIMGMRMLCGVNISHLKKRYGIDPLTYYDEELKHLIAQNLVSIENGHMKLTSKSLPLANQVLSQLV